MSGRGKVAAGRACPPAPSRSDWGIGNGAGGRGASGRALQAGPAGGRMAVASRRAQVEASRPEPQGSFRALFYSHDGLGFGHTRRNLAIAAALVEQAPGAAVLLATGTDDVARLGVPRGVEVLKLPALRKVANGRYEARSLPVAPEQILRLRAALLAAAVRGFRPHVLLVDKHPFGVRGELSAALKGLRSHGGRAVLGLRDILDDPAQVRREWGPHGLPGRIADYYDCVLVYGSRSVFDPVAAYGFPPGLAERTRFCGYVVTPPQAPAGLEEPPPPFAAGPRERPVVLATAGGGEDGFDLLGAFVRASEGAPWHGVVVAGPQAPDEHRRELRRMAARAGVEYHRFVPAMASWLGAVDALVCMGGYNTLGEALWTGVPTVCSPRTSPRVEQQLRARAFERRGLLRVVEPAELEPERLRREVLAALATPRDALQERARAELGLEGAREAAAHLLGFAAAGRAAARAGVAAA